VGSDFFSIDFHTLGRDGADVEVYDFMKILRQEETYLSREDEEMICKSGKPQRS